MSKKGPIRQMPFHLLVYAKKFLADKEKEGYKGIISKGGKPVKESVELDEATAKIKTTMADKVASGATRFGLKAKKEGGHVIISGAKGKLNDFLRVTIGRSSFGNASDVSESVELDEAADFMKMSKELLKHKSKGIEFEKAAAYVRLIHNNSAVSVQDKAFMALTKMLKDMDDLVKKTTITKILKDNGFKVRGGSLMREGLEDSVELGEEHLTEVKWTLGGKEVEVSKMTPAQIAQMRKMFGKIKTVSNDNPYKKKGKDMIADLSKLELKIIAKAKIKWLSDWAEEELRKRAPLDRRINIESLDENYRTLAVHGMGAETKNSINVGRDVDYYEPKNGDKRMGKITKMTKSGYVVKDEKDGKSHTFTFHDRVKAKALIAKHG